MKNFFYLMVAFAGLSASAQVGIGLPTENIAASAQFEVASTTKGFLTPRMTQAQKNAIASPAEGLLVYQTDGTSGFYYYNGSSWNSVGANLTGYATTSALSTEVTRAQNAETMLNTTVNTNAVQSNLAIQNVTSTVNQEVSRAQSAEATLTTSLNNKAPKASPSFTGTVTVGGALSTSSAVVEVTSTTQGFLPPRMTATQRNAISSPAAGLVLWCTNCGTNGELEVYNGTSWTNMVGGTVAATPHYVGEAFGGGIVAYILTPSDPGYNPNVQHGLIAATTAVVSVGTGLWVAWGPLNGYLLGTTSTAIGTGLQNSQKNNLACFGNQSGGNGFATGEAMIYRGGGLTDWYLPSKDELSKLMLNQNAIGLVNANNSAYWSSSEYDNYNAWYCFYNFNTGEISTGYTLKNGGFLVLPIRSF